LKRPRSRNPAKAGSHMAGSHMAGSRNPAKAGSHMAGSHMIGSHMIGSHMIGLYVARLRGIPEGARAGEHVGKSVARGFDGQPFPLTRWNRHVEIARVRGHPLDRPRFSPEVSAEDTYLRAIVVHDLGN